MFFLILIYGHTLSFTNIEVPSVILLYLLVCLRLWIIHGLSVVLTNFLHHKNLMAYVSL
jgi:hypothetical protein